MKKPEKWQSWLFIGSLVFIAVVINTSRRVQQIRQANPNLEQELAQPKTATPATYPARTQSDVDERTKILREEEAERVQQETKRAQYVARYVKGGATKAPGVERLTVLIGTETRRFNSSATAALLSRLRAGNSSADSSLFTPEFLSDGLIEEALNNPDALVKKLDLAKVTDTLVLGYQEVDYVTNTGLENVITANMRLVGTTISLKGMIESRSWSYSANGAGFTRSDARAMAEERLLKQIANDASFASKVSP